MLDELKAAQYLVNAKQNAMAWRLKNAPRPMHKFGDTVRIRLKSGALRLATVRSGFYISDSQGWLYKLRYITKGKKQVGCSRFEHQINVQHWNGGGT